MTQTVGTPVANAVTPGTMNVPFPTYAAGDSMFVLVGTKQMSTDTFANISGWQTIISVRSSTIVAIALYHKIMDGSEGSSLTVATIGSNDVNMGIAWVADDLDGTDAIDVIGTEGNSSTGAGAMTLPSITAGTTKRLYGAWVGFDNDGTAGTTTGAAAFTHPGDMSELFDAVTDVGADLSLGAAFLDTVTGATGTRAVTGTPSNLTNYRCMGFLFSANIAAGTPQDFDLTAATEADAAQVLSVTKTIFKTLTAATETDAAQALTAAGYMAITAAAETDTAQALSITTGSGVIEVTLVPATETYEASGIVANKVIVPATSTETAQALSFTKTIRKTLTPATESDTAQILGITRPGIYQLTPAGETDQAQPLTVTKTIFESVTPAVETDAAVALTRSRLIEITPALTTSTAQPLTFTKTIYKTISPATETNQARAITEPPVEYPTQWSGWIGGAYPSGRIATAETGEI